jgi:Cu-Zn family superoxide dismutase
MNYGKKAIAVFDTSEVKGYIKFRETPDGVSAQAFFEKLPQGSHGFHIHASGNLEHGCESACSHWNPFGSTHGDSRGQTRHAGDLGNIVQGRVYHYVLHAIGITCFKNFQYNLLGRTMIVHEGEDDLGLTSHPDSQTTGNSGKRIACAVIGLDEIC